MLHLNCKPTNNRHQQLIVDTYFKASVRDWEEIYTRKDLNAVIYQQRKTFVLALVDKLGLPLDEKVLEVGCGAGLTTVALAHRGYSVDAVDSVDEMANLTGRRAVEASVAHRVRTAVGDINDLIFPSDHFGLVVAIGVLPWLHSIYEPMRELARVTKPVGYLIVSVDNRWRLHELLDPRLNPIHAPIRKLARALLRRDNLPQVPETRRCSPREFDSILQKA